MNLYDNSLYMEDIKKIADMPLDWNKIKDSSVLVSGASGMIGSMLIDVLMYKKDINCNVYALGRNTEKAKARFSRHWNSGNFSFISGDINQSVNINENIDFIFHAASNTHPVAYATDPVGTVATNIIGTKNLLDLAVKCHTKRFVFASSVEVYGENKGDCEYFDEDYCGYINCNTLRAGYPESKRAGESLCQAYIKQNGIDIVIPRLSRTYGPTMLMSDTKAVSQFIKKGIAGEDIILKSEGTQFYSYSYVADAVLGVLFCLISGKCGEAYNVADHESDISLKNLAGIIADYTGGKVVFELPDETERAGYSKATKAVMNGDKLKSLGWKPMYTMETGIRRTIDILKGMD